MEPRITRTAFVKIQFMINRKVIFTPQRRTLGVHMEEDEVFKTQ